MKSSAIKNTVWILVGRVVRMIASMVVSLLTARYLGPSNFGVINYTSSVLAFFIAIAGVGFNGILVYEIIQSKDSKKIVLSTATLIEFFSGIVLSVIFLGFIAMTESNDKTMLWVAFLQSIQLPLCCSEVMILWYQAEEKMKVPVICQVVSNMCMLLYKVFLLVTQKGIVWFAFSTSVDSIVLTVILFTSFKKDKHIFSRFDKGVAVHLIKAGMPFCLANMMVVLYGRIGTVLLKLLLDSNSLVGLYSMAVTICGYISFIPAAIVDGIRPGIAKEIGIDEKRYRIKLGQMFSAILWVCILYSMFITLFGDIVIGLFGKEYISASNCLKICVWSSIFSSIGSGKNLWLVCEKKGKLVFSFSVIGVLTNISLNVLLIPRFGINGAAIATLVTEATTNFIVPALMPQTREYVVTVLKSSVLRGIGLRNYIAYITRNR